jgi:predicted nucleic acid-binding protein
MKLFVDTSAWCALYDKKDQYHQRAKTFALGFAKKPVSLFTSDFVFDEIVTLLLTHTNHDTAVQFGEFLRGSETVVMAKITSEIQSRAWEIFVRHKDKNFSFTDCTSFVVMETLGIHTAFTFDKNFAQHGLRSTPEKE